MCEGDSPLRSGGTSLLSFFKVALASAQEACGLGYNEDDFYNFHSVGVEAYGVLPSDDDEHEIGKPIITINAQGSCLLTYCIE